jgi:hypothetical protein
VVSIPVQGATGFKMNDHCTSKQLSGERRTVVNGAEDGAARAGQRGARKFNLRDFECDF